MLKIYHNPQCSKSRQALDLLLSKKLQPEVILYLKNPPSKTELKQLLTMLGFNSARQLMRNKEALYQELELANPALSEAQLLSFLVANPKLMERPIVVNNGQARIARPTEKILEIL